MQTLMIFFFIIDPGELFAINADTGNITTAKTLDSEAQGSPDGIVSLIVTVSKLLKIKSIRVSLHTCSRMFTISVIVSLWYY